MQIPTFQLSVTDAGDFYTKKKETRHKIVKYFSQTIERKLMWMGPLMSRNILFILDGIFFLVKFFGVYRNIVGSNY